jgi:hypothetical protein
MLGATNRAGAKGTSDVIVVWEFQYASGHYKNGANNARYASSGKGAP